MKKKTIKKTTRREMLKTMALSAGLFVCRWDEQTVMAQQRGQGQGGGGVGQRAPLPIAASNPSIRHHKNRCKSCGRCREFCRNEITVFGRTVPPSEDACIRCGQCTMYCKRYALTEQYHYPVVVKAVADSDLITVASTSPAIRVALGEMFRMPCGTNVEGKIVGALKRLGVNHVLDTAFSADLTVMEEASELLQRINDNGMKNSLPMFTSCCPAWVRFVKLFYPGLLPNLSTVKSPVMMQGAMVKTYFAQKIGIDPTNMVHIALTPCTAKKAEILLPGMNAAGILHEKPEMQDVDIALTCRELAYLINDAKIDFAQMPEGTYDSLMGAGSGAGMIFGNTGGVMEAALRTAYKLLNDKNPPADFLNLRPVRGFDSVRTAIVDIGKRSLHVAVVHGIAKTRPLFESIRNGERKFDFIEVMACPGGCIGGGGQPINFDIGAMKLKQHRLNALYQRDTENKIRLSYDNPQIQAIYAEFLGKPLDGKAKTLLHYR